MKRLVILCALLFSFVTAGWAGVDFDAVDDYIEISVGTQVVNNFSVCAWIKTDETTNLGAIFSWINDASYGLGNPRIILLYYSGGKAIIGYRITSDEGVGSTFQSCSSTADIDDNAWHHVCATRNGVDLKIYVDAISDSCSKKTGSIDFGASSVMEIGRWNAGTGSGWSGYIEDSVSEISFWLYELSVTEISVLYNSKIKTMPLQIQPSNLKGYWPMDDQPSGTSADADTVRDLSGNGNHGTGYDGANNTGLTWTGETVLSYPPSPQ